MGGTGRLWDYRTRVWDYRESTWTLDSDLLGYVVHVDDGVVGTVVRASSAAAAAYLVVDTATSFGGMRLVPAGTVTSLRHGDRSVHLGLARNQLAGAPAYAGDARDDALRGSLEGYFRPLGCC